MATIQFRTITQSGKKKMIWLFYRLLFFLKKDYKAYLIFDENKKLIHHSFIIPTHFRFPFMEKNDIQISNVWTSDAHRNKGIASYVVNKICAENKDKGIWYICREDNIKSIKVALKAGFVHKFDCERHYKFKIPFYKRA